MKWMKTSLCLTAVVLSSLQDLSAQRTNEAIGTAATHDRRSAFADEEHSPLPVQVFTLRHPSFGSFATGAAGGSIEVDLDGQRSANGDVVLLNSGSAVAPAVFEVKCSPYTSVHLFSNAQFVLRNNDGSTLNAYIVETSPEFPLVAPDHAASGFTVTAAVKLVLGPGQLLSPGGYTGQLQMTWISE